MAAGTIVQFPFRGGIDEKADPKNATPGTLIALVNMRQNKTGQLARRFGHTALSMSILGGGSLAACKRLASRKTELLLSDGEYLYGYSPETTAWRNVNYVPNVIARHQTVQQYNTVWFDSQYATVNNVEAFVWVDGFPQGISTAGTITGMARDLASGTILSPAKFIAGAGLGGSNSGYPSLTVVGQYIVVCWVDAGNNVKCSILDSLNPSAGWCAPIGLASDAVFSTSPGQDAVAVDDGYFVLVYASSTGISGNVYAIRAQVTSASAVAVASTGVVQAALGTVQAFALAYDAVGGIVYFTSSNSAGPATTIDSFSATTLATINFKSLASTTGQALFSGVCVMSTTDIRVIYSMASDGADAHAYWSYTPSSNSGVDQGKLFWGQLNSKPWIVNGRVYVIWRYAQTHYVCELLEQGAGTINPMRPTCTLVPREAYSLADTTGSGEPTAPGATLCRAYNTSGVHWRTVGTQIADAELASRNGLLVHDMSFGDDWLANGSSYPAQHLQPVEFGELLHFSGGVPFSYDGSRISEMSFLYGPQAADVRTSPSTTGGFMAKGTYQYCFAYEWIDSAGQVYRSTPSLPVTVITTGMAATNSVGLQIPMLALTLKASRPGILPTSPDTLVQIIVYRTLVNGDGSLFYRQTPYAVPSTNFNNPAAAFASVTDTLADATISASATATLLYTNGGTQPNECPSSLGCLIKHHRRLAGIGDDGRTVWFSSEYVDRESPNWGDYLQQEFDSPLTAIASMDSYFIAFSQDEIWYMTGDGPNLLGQGSDWSSLTKIQTDTGCVDPRSILSTNDGILFRGRKGMYLLDRSLNVTYAGGLVEDTDAANPLDVCSLSAVRGETSCFISIVANTTALTAISTGQGIRKHWDTYRKMWAQDWLTDGSQVSRAVAGLAAWNGTTAWATPQGQVYQQVTTQWTDGSSWYDSSFTTAYVSASGPMGWQRVRQVQVNGDGLSNHDLKLSVCFDTGSVFQQSYQWRAGQANTLALQDYLRMRIGSQNGANPRCQGLKLKCEILTPTNPTAYPIGTGQGATLSGVGFEIVPKTGMRRVGAGAET